MPSLKSLKNRIKSVKNTQKITKAMKMVAASKLKRAREGAEAASPYAERMSKMVKNLAHSGADAKQNGVSLLKGTGSDKVHLVIVVSSDRGLCGSFNHSILKASRKHISSLIASGKKVNIVCLGKKCHDMLKGQYSSNIVKYVDGIGRKGVTFEEAKEIADYVIEQFHSHGFDKLWVVYSKFKSVISQVVTVDQLIPLSQEGEKVIDTTPYSYEPSQDDVLAELLPNNIRVQIFKALLDNSASEHGARMTAMENATRNSGEMIKKLTTVYNRSRQAQITKELIEIISGAETIKG